MLDDASLGALATLGAVILGILAGARFERARVKQSEAEAVKATADAELSKAETFKQYIDATNSAWEAVGELRNRVVKAEQATEEARVRAAGAELTANEAKRELDACLAWKRESEKRWAETVTMHRAASEVLGYTANGSKPLQEKVDEVNVSIEKLQESLDVESRNT